ncbi:MAG: hypothetical protein WA742_08315, partial [Candidatus Cybelea sp.]
NYVDGLNQEVEMGVLQGLVTVGGRLYSNAEPTIDHLGNTEENSNIVYSSLPVSYPNGEFYQLCGFITWSSRFSVQEACANSVRHKARIGAKQFSSTLFPSGATP